MRSATLRRLLHLALFGLLLWFFGNLYEEIILMPNWLAAPMDVLRAYNRYYTVVIQYHYYVPITQLAVLIVTGLTFSRHPMLQPIRPMLRKAAVWGWLGIGLTVWLVLSLNLDLFVGRLTLTEAEAHRKGFIWMLGNAARLLCVGLSFGYSLRARDQFLLSTKPTAA